MLMFFLAISFLTTSNLPWFMDLTFQVPMQYCSLEYQTLLSPPGTSTSEHHFHFGPASSFFLELFLHWSYRPGEFIFQCPIFLPFHTVHGVLAARILQWFAISSSSGPWFYRTLHYDPSVLCVPAQHGSQLRWVNQAPLSPQGCDTWSGFHI